MASRPRPVLITCLCAAVGGAVPTAMASQSSGSAPTTIPSQFDESASSSADDVVAPTSEESGEAVLVDRLVELGYAADYAGVLISSLTAEDIEVFVANPLMLQLGGDSGNSDLAIHGGVFLVILLLAALAPAASNEDC